MGTADEIVVNHAVCQHGHTKIAEEILNTFNYHLRAMRVKGEEQFEVIMATLSRRVAILLTGLKEDFASAYCEDLISLLVERTEIVLLEWVHRELKAESGCGCD